ncbi:hypothetical protein CY34DRAFT_809815 [Suillus luteus UH-Slu-Lm8-n1]|uniref:Uncharacterized protein n=1 Tax=Suillus luteus UH-Slu-Lm8-n1 TaxID=930992 RepID=A0A0D0B1Y8_9AGAM|nr:hypothetical protein CY34DRAFT_809815 [Suillus luteus UH-Slu-Lm8-n1]
MSSRHLSLSVNEANDLKVCARELTFLLYELHNPLWNFLGVIIVSLKWEVSAGKTVKSVRRKVCPVTSSSRSWRKVYQPE